MAFVDRARYEYSGRVLCRETGQEFHLGTSHATAHKFLHCESREESDLEARTPSSILFPRHEILYSNTQTGAAVTLFLGGSDRFHRERNE